MVGRRRRDRRGQACRDATRPEGEVVRLILGWRDLPPLPRTPLTATSATSYRRNPARRRADQPLPGAARWQPRWPVRAVPLLDPGNRGAHAAARLHRVRQS